MSSPLTNFFHAMAQMASRCRWPSRRCQTRMLPLAMTVKAALQSTSFIWYRVAVEVGNDMRNSSSAPSLTIIPSLWLWCFAPACCKVPKLTRLAVSLGTCSTPCRTTVLIPSGSQHRNSTDPVPATGTSRASPTEMVSFPSSAVYERK